MQRTREQATARGHDSSEAARAAPPLPTSSAPALFKPTLVKHLRPLLEVADEAGADPDALLAALGLTRLALQKDSTQRPYYQLHWLAEQLIAQCADPEIGLRVAERAEFAHLEVFGHLIRHFLQLAPNLYSVLELLARFWTRVCGTSQTTLHVEAGIVRIRIVPSVEPPLELYDSAAGASCRLIQRLGGARLRPLEVRLPRPTPPRPERYEQFFGAPVVFRAEALELLYTLEALQAPALGLAEDDANGQPRSSASTLSAQVRAHVLATLAEGVPQLPRVARMLGFSARTLRRRLAALRTSYAELVDDSRRERALALARRGGLDVARLAELTGFGDASAFARAFRRWTGQAPKAFMQRAAADGATGRR